METLSLFGEVEPVKVVRNRASGPHQEAVDGWTRLWLEKKKARFAWTPKEARAVKLGLRAAGGNVAAYLEVARRLLFGAPRPWYEQEASPSLLYSHWNVIVGWATPKLATKAKSLCVRCKGALTSGVVHTQAGDCCQRCYFQ